MKPLADRELEREIARSLVAALEAALAPGGSMPELRAARDAAQLLDLPGLDRLMAALAPHAAHPWPAEILPVVERLQRVSARITAGDGLAEFRRADTDFHALAGEIVGMEWSSLSTHSGAEGPSIPTLSAAEMLSDLPLKGDESASVARRVRLTMPVAAAVRAAIDWLAGREGVRHALELREDASVLEIGCEMRDRAGVPAAHEVLAAADGNLGPAFTSAGEAGGGSWIIRVPAFSPRPAYVMLEQGTLRLAVPWHAVLKLQVVPRKQIESRATRVGMSVIPPLAPLAARGTESPVVVLAHGLRRGWMVADRLVWRLAADACEPNARAREAGLEKAVSTDDGEIFGLAVPRALLAAVPLPGFLRSLEARGGTPRAAEAPAAAEAPPIAEAPPEAEAPRAPMAAAPVAPASAPAAAPSVPANDPPEYDDASMVLDERWVTPLPAAAEVEAPAEAAPVQASAPVEPPRREPARGQEPAFEHVLDLRRRALVAEDSLTARIFLARLLEQEGFEVVEVERATDLHAALGNGPWSMVFVDLELPDGRGSGLLGAVRGALSESTVLVALARDENDFMAARAAGVWRTLRKPVEPGALRRLLARVGLAERDPG